MRGAGETGVQLGGFAREAFGDGVEQCGFGVAVRLGAAVAIEAGVACVGVEGAVVEVQYREVRHAVECGGQRRLGLHGKGNDEEAQGGPLRGEGLCAFEEEAREQGVAVVGVVWDRGMRAAVLYPAVEVQVFPWAVVAAGFDDVPSFEGDGAVAQDEAGEVVGPCGDDVGRADEAVAVVAEVEVDGDAGEVGQGCDKGGIVKEQPHLLGAVGGHGEVAGLVAGGMCCEACGEGFAVAGTGAEGEGAAEEEGDAGVGPVVCGGGVAPAFGVEGHGLFEEGVRAASGEVGAGGLGQAAEAEAGVGAGVCAEGEDAQGVVRGGVGGGLEAKGGFGQGEGEEHDGAAEEEGEGVGVAADAGGKRAKDGAVRLYAGLGVHAAPA